VNQEQVDVVKLEALEGVIDGPEDVVVAVEVVPDLGGHEDVRSLDGGVLLEEIADTLANLVLVQVEPGTVKVTVASAQSSGNGSIGLALGALAGESAETDGGDLNPVAQCESLSVGHDCGSIGMVIRKEEG
jgi:hypothetical protein